MTGKIQTIDIAMSLLKNALMSSKKMVSVELLFEEIRQQVGIDVFGSNQRKQNSGKIWRPITCQSEITLYKTLWEIKFVFGQ